MKWTLILLIILVGCSLPSREITDFNRVGAAITKRLKNEDHIKIFALGYLGPGKFKGIDLSLTSPLPADIPEARRQMVNVIQKIVETVNQDNLFQEDLEEVPFEPKHILMSLDFAPSEAGLTMAITAHARISYFIDDPETGRSLKVFQETLEEALTELQKEAKE